MGGRTRVGRGLRTSRRGIDTSRSRRGGQGRRPLVTRRRRRRGHAPIPSTRRAFREIHPPRRLPHPKRPSSKHERERAARRGERAASCLLIVTVTISIHKRLSQPVVVVVVYFVSLRVNLRVQLLNRPGHVLHRRVYCSRIEWVEVLILSGPRLRLRLSLRCRTRTR